MPRLVITMSTLSVPINTEGQNPAQINLVACNNLKYSSRAANAFRGARHEHSPAVWWHLAAVIVKYVSLCVLEIHVHPAVMLPMWLLACNKEEYRLTVERPWWALGVDGRAGRMSRL